MFAVGTPSYEIDKHVTLKEVYRGLIFPSHDGYSLYTVRTCSPDKKKYLSRQKVGNLKREKRQALLTQIESRDLYLTII